MAITPYLAMTASEFAECTNLPSNIAWMACHFSPYSMGLSNIPMQLPKNAVLLLNDTTPIYRHDVQTICTQLTGTVEKLGCRAVILDFQKAIQDSTIELIRRLCEALPCPVAVPSSLAQGHHCPVFLPPCPLYEPLERYIASWHNQEIWLDISLEAWEIEIDPTGAAFNCISSSLHQDNSFTNMELCCHYHIQQKSGKVIFTLWRTREDLMAYLEKAKDLGIQHTIGLYQELHKYVL